MRLKFKCVTTLSNDLNIARKAAQAGAAVISTWFGRSVESMIKRYSRTLVTDTDLAAEKEIFEILRNHSDYGIISEEGGDTGLPDVSKWVVALDETSNFTHSLPLFAVSVGLGKGHNQNSRNSN